MRLIKYVIYTAVVLLMVACGGSDSSPTDPSGGGGDTPTPPSQESTSITIYVHGYSKSGYKRVAIYGDVDPYKGDTDLLDSVGFSTDYRGADTDLSKNILVSTSYYGDQSPSYYSEEDRREIEAITAQYGGGIPRYAMILAKFAKHIRDESGASHVNFLSVSMGSLVTRWAVEKDLETLSSAKQIAKWLSIEGVIGGNYVASEPLLTKIANIYEKQSPEVEHMSYSWIDTNLGSRDTGNSPYYRDIKLGFEGSTKDDDLGGVLSRYLMLKGDYYPNDGYQLLKDTSFGISNPSYLYRSQTPIRGYFHENHTSIKYNQGAWVQASLFFKSTRRVKITLTNATIYDIHEVEAIRPAEILFSSSTTSQISSSMVDQRDIDSGALTIHSYANSGDNQLVNQELFDGMVSMSETALTLNIECYEIDNSIKYKIVENSSNTIDDLGGGSFDIPLQAGLHNVSGGDWSGQVRVELFDY